jgi:hypothetical protein
MIAIKKKKKEEIQKQGEKLDKKEGGLGSL